MAGSFIDELNYKQDSDSLGGRRGTKTGRGEVGAARFELRHAVGLPGDHGLGVRQQNADRHGNEAAQHVEQQVSGDRGGGLNLWLGVAAGGGDQAIFGLGGVAALGLGRSMLVAGVDRRRRAQAEASKAEGLESEHCQN